jgi:aspartate kinase
MKIMKVGGTSVGKPERMRQIAQLITADKEPVMVVLSALSGTTNALLEISQLLAASDKQGSIEKIAILEKHYQNFIDDLFQDDSIHVRAKESLNEHFDFLRITQKISLSDALSKDLYKRGFKFVGSTIIYAYMQAAGLVNDHLVDCFRFTD